jgi:hypothetical protein
MDGVSFPYEILEQDRKIAERIAVCGLNQKFMRVKPAVGIGSPPCEIVPAMTPVCSQEKF